MSAAPIIVMRHHKLSTLLANPLRRAQVHATVMPFSKLRATVQCTVVSPEGDSELCVFAPRLVERLVLTYDTLDQHAADGRETRYELHFDGHRIRVTPQEAHVLAAELQGFGLKVEEASPPVAGDACFITTESVLSTLFANPLRKAQLCGRIVKLVGVTHVEYTMLTPEGDAELIGFGPVPASSLALRIGRDRSAADGVPQIARRFLGIDGHRIALTGRDMRICVADLTKLGLQVKPTLATSSTRSTP